MRLFQAAGLPDGVINLVYGSGATIGDAALARPDLAGHPLHRLDRASSTRCGRRSASDIGRYRNYPRIVGETGGKDFILAHPSADLDALAAAIVRGSFEYQGQKCSAASRVYAPSNLWPALRERLAEEVATIKVGDVADFGNFMGAVIDASSFATQREAIEEARAHAETEIVVGGGCDDSTGFFVEPTVIETRDPGFRLLRDELFGPVVTTYVYDEHRFGDDARPRRRGHAPTGSPARSSPRTAPRSPQASERLRYAAGNFYVNDKPTGAVVGQQPFGGSRASGTNDKAGSIWNLIRWVSPRTLKDTFVPPQRLPLPVPRLSARRARACAAQETSNVQATGGRARRRARVADRDVRARLRARGPGRRRSSRSSAMPPPFTLQLAPVDPERRLDERRRARVISIATCGSVGARAAPGSGPRIAIVTPLSGRRASGRRRGGRGPRCACAAAVDCTTAQPLPSKSIAHRARERGLRRDRAPPSPRRGSARPRCVAAVGRRRRGRRRSRRAARRASRSGEAPHRRHSLGARLGRAVGGGSLRRLPARWSWA